MNLHHADLAEAVYVGAVVAVARKTDSGCELGENKNSQHATLIFARMLLMILSNKTGEAQLTPRTSAGVEDLQSDPRNVASDSGKNASSTSENLVEERVDL